MPQTAPAKYAFIDALRGLAFLGVLCHHVVARTPGLDSRSLTFFRNGHEGVQLFFLVSALTLFLSLDARSKAERRPVVNFFIRRFFRIAPLFYAAALFYYWFDRGMTGGAGPGGTSLVGILATLTFTNGWTVAWINRLVPGGWSIAVEMNFYLLVPILYRKVCSAQSAAIGAFVLLLAGGAASAAVRTVLHKTGAGSDEAIDRFAWYWLPAQLPIFFLGIALFHLVKPALQDASALDRWERRKARLMLAVSAYLIVTVSFSTTSLYLGHGLFGVAFLLLAWSLSLNPTVWIVNPVVCFIGTVSFSAYLSHFAVLDLTELALGRWPTLANLTAAPLARFALLLGGTLAGTLIVSTMTYRLIERPGQAIGKRLINWLEARTASARPPVPETPTEAGI